MKRVIQLLLAFSASACVDVAHAADMNKVLRVAFPVDVTGYNTPIPG